MKDFLSGVVVAALVAVGIVFFTHKTAPQPQPPLGASNGTEHYNTENFYNGLTLGAPALSSSSPAALGASPSFFITATTTSQNASSTLVRSLKTQVYWQFASTTPVAGVTCNTGAPATSTVSVITSSTSPSINGFVLNMSAAPSGATLPYCVQGWIMPDYYSARD